MKGRLVALLALAAVCAPASAEPFRQLAPGEAVTIRPDRAYLLIRVQKSAHAGKLSPIFLRVPGAAELEEYEQLRRAAYAKAGSKGAYEEYAFQNKKFSNLYGLDLGKPYAESGNQRTVIVEVDPGTYVLAGSGNKRLLSTCFCLGTVQLAAKAGELTDAGTIFGDLASKASPEPELAGVTNLGSIAQMDYVVMAGAVRPYREGDVVPAAAGNLPRAAADYRAVGAFVLREALLVNFLAPVPGVLEYRRGEVFDVKSGQLVPAR